MFISLKTFPCCEEEHAMVKTKLFSIVFTEFFFALILMWSDWNKKETSTKYTVNLQLQSKTNGILSYLRTYSIMSAMSAIQSPLNSYSLQLHQTPIITNKKALD